MSWGLFVVVLLDFFIKLKFYLLLFGYFMLGFVLILGYREELNMIFVFEFID